MADGHKQGRLARKQTHDVPCRGRPNFGRPPQPVTGPTIAEKRELCSEACCDKVGIGRCQCVFVGRHRWASGRLVGGLEAIEVGDQPIPQRRRLIGGQNGLRWAGERSCASGIGNESIRICLIYGSAQRHRTPVSRSAGQPVSRSFRPAGRRLGADAPVSPHALQLDRGHLSSFFRRRATRQICLYPARRFRAFAPIYQSAKCLDDRSLDAVVNDNGD